MRRQLVEVIHYPERMESAPLSALDVDFGIFPDLARAVGMEERSVAKAGFHKIWEYRYCKQISQILWPQGAVLSSSKVSTPIYCQNNKPSRVTAGLYDY
jgi:hypothetical protein